MVISPARRKVAAVRGTAQLIFQIRLRRRELILIERPYVGIGDLLCLLAAATALRRVRPRAWLVLAAHPAVAALAEATGLVDQVVLLSARPHRLAQAWVRPENYHLALLPDELTPPQPRPRISLADQFARGLGLGAAGPLPRLAPSAADVGRLRRRLLAAGWDGRTRLMVCHAGPTWPVKEWPAARWVELRAELSRESLFWIQVGADDPAGRRVPRIAGALDWVNTLSLLDLAALLASAAVFVGIDSGPLHIAGAVGTPLVGLFGPTDPGCFLPPGPNAHGRQAPVDCRSCHHDPGGPRHWRTGCPFDIRCMHELAAASAASAIRACLAAAQTREMACA